MAVATELGISEQEIQDAMNLEKLYSLIKRFHITCSKCGNNAPSHVDCGNFQFLCGTHAAGRSSSCKQIGVERFSSYEIQRLTRKYGSASLTQISYRSKSNHGISEKKRSSSRTPRRKKSFSNNRDIFDNGTDSDENFKSFSRAESTKPHNRSQLQENLSQPTFASSFDENFQTGVTSNYYTATNSQYPPGMARFLMQSSNINFPCSSNRYSHTLAPDYSATSAFFDTNTMQKPSFDQQALQNRHISNGYNNAVQYQNNGIQRFPYGPVSSLNKPDLNLIHPMDQRNYPKQLSAANLCNPPILEQRSSPLFPNFASLPDGFQYQLYKRPAQFNPTQNNNLNHSYNTTQFDNLFSPSLNQYQQSMSFLPQHATQINSQTTSIKKTNPFQIELQTQPQLMHMTLQSGHHAQKSPASNFIPYQKAESFTKPLLTDFGYQPVDQPKQNSPYQSVYGAVNQYNLAPQNQPTLHHQSFIGQRFNSTPSDFGLTIPHVTASQKDWWD